MESANDRKVEGGKKCQRRRQKERKISEQLKKREREERIVFALFLFYFEHRKKM